MKMCNVSASSGVSGAAADAADHPSPTCGPPSLGWRRKGCPWPLFSPHGLFKRGRGVRKWARKGLEGAPRSLASRGIGCYFEGKRNKLRLLPRHLPPGHRGYAPAVRGRGSLRPKSLVSFLITNPLRAWQMKTSAKGPEGTPGGSVPPTEADAPSAVLPLPQTRKGVPKRGPRASAEVHTYPRSPRWTAPASLRRSPALSRS